MAGSVNKVILVGNLGKDPEIRSFQNGGKVASFSIATSESWKDKTTGEKKEKTEWHRISVMNEKLVEIIERYVKKGSKLYIEGQLETRKWTDKEGHEGMGKTATIIVPPKIAELVHGGMELGHATDKFFGLNNSKHQNGLIGSLTDGHITRVQLYWPAAIIALTQISHKDWYF